jgi:hypothetical protein
VSEPDRGAGVRRGAGATSLAAGAGGRRRDAPEGGLAGQYAAARLTDRHQRWLRLLKALIADEPYALAGLPEPRHLDQLQNSLNTQPLWQTVPRDQIAQSRRLSPFGEYPAVAAATMLARVAEALAAPPDGGEAGGSSHRELVQQVTTHLQRTGLSASFRSGPVAAPAEADAAEVPEPTPHPFFRELSQYPSTPETGFLRLLALELVDERPDSERVVTEPVVFHKDTLGRSGALTLTLLESGPAGIYPDPSVMSFLNPDRSFLDSLASAAAQLPAKLEGRCILWSLTTEHHDPVNNITGPSIGVAFAVALAALADPVPWRAVAGRFAAKHPRLVRRTAITAELVGAHLSAVSGHDHKISAARDVGVDLLVDAHSYRRGSVNGEPLRQHARTRDVGLRGAQTLEQARRRSRPRPTAAGLAVLTLLCLLVLVPATVAGMRAQDARQSAQAASTATAPSPLPTGPLVVDGVFGHLTCAALQRSLNEHHGEQLDVDGSCGRLSYSALQRALGVEVTGERDEATIKALQRRLGVVPADGVWGPATVERLQVALNANEL